MVSLPHCMNVDVSWRLCADGIEVRWGRRRVVGGFSWEHRPGRIAWLVGENGAGKSSLLRVLAGRARPAAGRVRWCGPPGTPTRAVYYHPEMRPPAGATIDDWARLLAALLPDAPERRGVAALAPAGASPGKRLDRLSTGEARRLLLVAILRRGAPFLLLDEPYAHLSPEAGEALTDVLIDRARSDVVVVATNREVPTRAAGPVLRLDGDRVDPVVPSAGGAA